MGDLILPMIVYAVVVVVMVIVGLAYARNGCCSKCLQAVQKTRQEEDSEDPPVEGILYCPNGCPGACACPTLDDWDVRLLHHRDPKENVPSAITQSTEYEEYKANRRERSGELVKYLIKRISGDGDESSTDDEDDDICQDTYQKRLLSQSMKKTHSLRGINIADVIGNLDEDLDKEFDQPACVHSSRANQRLTNSADELGEMSGYERN